MSSSENKSQTSHNFHQRVRHAGRSVPIGADDSFENFVAREIGVEAIKPEDAWQSKPITLDIDGIETEIRRDYLFDEYVIVSPGRGKRPYDTSKNRHPLIETADSPRLDKEKEVYSIKEDGEWLVKVVKNRYSALTMDNPKAHGSQELVIDTPLANVPFARLSLAQIGRVLKAYQMRTANLLSKKGIAYVLIFRNDGFEAGASLAHAHSQIFAMPVIPKRFQDHSNQIEQYYLDKKKQPIEDIISFERSQKKRIIAEDQHFFVICPYASQYPFEAWLIPKRHVVSFDKFSTSQLESCAHQLKHLTQKLTGAQISFNFFIENGISPHYRCIIKLYGRSSIWGGFEVATGMVINTVPPESATSWYRSVK